MNTTCEPCTIAETKPRTGHYGASCMQCAARAFAQSPLAHQAHGGDPGPLQAAMRMLWKTPEAYRAGRIAVYQWIKRLEQP
jgi:hypothetical protein